ncbi:ABC transporter ATP-binding protein [Alicyclobacillus fastidiosus]|uniref:ABC transporter ATP-binding protein n=1 Tax=Alicyclobacillus fastidiosus TaxID=392011 RepID=A0ABY6ZEQ0_9BACL|nr:ABC transporter ATP-binding protein [Alicyclobacillus fastidiosus]WAH41374.1 ABC transporter ATP-binding protein [Alicyclobacillus fastidiosus]GMA62988.1 ABC transporter ATP-binding protein [Alicyclobacillus fastidiosus]
MGKQALVDVQDLVIRFAVGRGSKRKFITPVDNVSFQIAEREVLAVVGESGSGKSTIGRALVRVLTPSQGKIYFDGTDVTKSKGRGLRNYRENVQMIFQDPFGSLNPVNTIEQHLKFPIRRHQKLTGSKLHDKIEELLTVVGLTPANEVRYKYPHELSGGQRQRIAIARALAVNPKFLVADEPISMLDVSIRADILELLNELKDNFDLSYLYITHDLASAHYFGDKIMVLYGGRVMEMGLADELIRNPKHPYTHLLLAATPGTAARRNLKETAIQAPNLFEGRKGCPFAHRCPKVTDVCRQTAPALSTMDRDTHLVACHHID